MISVETFTEDYNWCTAFEYNPDGFVPQLATNNPTGEKGARWSFDDIEQVLAVSDGMNDEASWIALLWLKDGRYVFVSAWCDYTGWDCQSGCHSYCAGDIVSLERWAMSAEDCQRFGTTKPPEDP